MLGVVWYMRGMYGTGGPGYVRWEVRCVGLVARLDVVLYEKYRGSVVGRHGVKGVTGIDD